MRRVMFFGAVVLAAVLAAVGPAGATWTQQTTPNVSGETSSTLGGVSCPSRVMCMAVGAVTDAGGTHLLAERWDGSTWTVQTTTAPSGATSSELESVSCASANVCLAVGSFTADGAQVPFADMWNGSWTLQSTPLPAGEASGDLSGISCATTTRCKTVGFSRDASNVTQALAESWAGTTWTIDATPNPAGATASTLNAVSCTSATRCTAVGASTNASASEVTLAEAWNGTAWSVQSTPNPTGSTSSTLNGVSCPTAGMCMAVGSGFAEQFDGVTWTIEPIVKPRGHNSDVPDLAGVSCASTTRCAAVGSFFLDAVLTQVAEIWNGGHWLLQTTTISSPNDSSALESVSCKLVDQCMAAGSFHNSFTNRNHTLTESFSIVWQQQNFTTPFGSIAGSVDGVSCPTAKMCAAVGNFETSSDSESLAETWDGSTWTVRSTPNAPNSALNAVSCTAPTACTAVGDVVSGGAAFSLAERFDGTLWTVQTTPNPTGATRVFLNAVSCPTATSCSAVGAFTDAAGHQVPFAERWNGTTWALEPVPNPAGATISELDGVSCTSAVSCVAVGSQGPSNSGALAEVWNGSAWAIHSPTFSAGLNSSILRGVSCQSPTSCIAVGSINSTVAGRRFALAEQWNGSAWTDLGALSPAGTKLPFLNAVSCVNASNCVAVGTLSVGASSSTTLSETWDGRSWTLRFPENPDPVGSNALSSVSCPSTLECIGTGSFDGTFLAEQYS